MKNYETVFILNPALSEEQVEKAVDKYEKFLKSNGAKIVSKEIWGLKKPCAIYMDTKWMAQKNFGISAQKFGALIEVL